MRMILRYEGGMKVEAVLLSIDSRRMRVAIDSADDAMMFVRADDYWYGENGEIVQIESAAFEADNAKSIVAGGYGVN